MASTRRGMMPRLGSSSIRKRGRDMSARAIASICPSPPESVPARWRARSRRTGKSVWTRSSISRRWAASALVKVPRVRFSATVRRLKSRRPSGTSATPSRTRLGASRSPMGRPAKRISPLRGATSPAIVLRSVVLPAPFAPMSATISPGRTWSETPWRASTPAPYATSTSRMSRSAPSRETGGAGSAPTVVLPEVGFDHLLIPREHVRLRREPGELEEVPGALPRRADTRVALEGAADDILEHRHPTERAHELPGARDAETADALRTGVGDVGAREDDPSRVRVEVAGEAVEERGLAGAVRPDQPDDLARADREGDVLVGNEAAEALRDRAELEEGRHAQPCPTSRPEAGRPAIRRAQRLHGSERIPVGRSAAIRTMMTP